MTENQLLKIERDINPYVQKWNSEGRTEEQQWAVRNFLTGAGLSGLLTLKAKWEREAVEKNSIESRLPKHKASLHITHNENTTNYESVEKYIEDLESRDNHIEWATENSRSRAILTNSIWELHWYPDTPIGFYNVYGATLEEVLASLNPTNPTKEV